MTNEIHHQFDGASLSIIVPRVILIPCFFQKRKDAAGVSRGAGIASSLMVLQMNLKPLSAWRGQW